MISDTQVHSPRQLSDALAWLAEHGTNGKVLAGGTDLMVFLNARSLTALRYLDIWRLDELRGIADDGDNIRIGALTTYTEIIQSPLLGKLAPILREASLTVVAGGRHAAGLTGVRCCARGW